MVKVEEVLKTIDNNNKLSKEIKENVKSLLVIYTANDNKVDLKTLDGKLSNLQQIKSAPSYLVKEPLKYIDQEQTLYINKKEFGNDHDYQFYLMKELILMQTYKEKRNSYYEPIYEGYSAMAASLYVGNGGSTNIYEDEVVAFNLLGQIVGFECLENFFLTNDENLLHESLYSAGNSLDNINNLFNLMNYNLKSKGNIGEKSTLGDIQICLINMFANKEGKTKEDVEKFQSHLCTNKNLFTNPDRYKNLNHVEMTFEQLTLNINLEPNKSKSR